MWQDVLSGAIGAGVARFLHTEEVTGSIPVSPTGLVRSATREPFGGDIAPQGSPSRLIVEPLFIRVGAQMGPRLRQLLIETFLRETQFRVASENAA